MTDITCKIKKTYFINVQSHSICIDEDMFYGILKTLPKKRISCQTKKIKNITHQTYFIEDPIFTPNFWSL